VPRGRCRLAVGGGSEKRSVSREGREVRREYDDDDDDGWERPGRRSGRGGRGDREDRRGGAGVRRPGVIKARQELWRDERTAAPEDTVRDLCDSDIQPASQPSVAERATPPLRERSSAYRPVASRPRRAVSRGPISPGVVAALKSRGLAIYASPRNSAYRREFSPDERGAVPFFARIVPIRTRVRTGECSDALYALCVSYVLP